MKAGKESHQGVLETNSPGRTTNLPCSGPDHLWALRGPQLPRSPSGPIHTVANVSAPQGIGLVTAA